MTAPLEGPVIVGISAHFHDSACAVMVGGRLIAAAHEERFTRRKQDPGIPREALRHCLREAGLTIADVDCIAYYEDPAKKLDRQLWTALPDVPETGPHALFRFDADRPRREIREVLGFDGPVEIVEHHLSHAASAYYFSGFEDSAVLTVDAVGEWATTTWGRGTGADLDLLDEVEFPHSLGLLYSTITGHLGFEVNEGEYKVMGLAPYGVPRYADRVRELIDVTADGKFSLDLSYFDFRNPAGMGSERLAELLGLPPRMPESEIEQAHCDLARSIQTVTEETLLALAHRARRLVPSDNLCMAGGVALNVVAVRRIVEEGPFRDVFVQPAAGDAGGSLGAAAVAHRRLTGQRPSSERMRTALLGGAVPPSDVARKLRAAGTDGFLDFTDREPELLAAVAERLAAGKVIGWVHGRMEFGPRALGGRSILADPRGADTRDRINASVKMREGFRPFAPAVLAERAAEHFRLDHESPFMLETCEVVSPLDLPAITHVDRSARVQTVTEEANGRFYRLIKAFDERTGCPILLNTSFNLRGEPIVWTPEDALLCFLRSAIDCLVLEDFVIDREALPEVWRTWFENTRPSRGSAVSDTVYTLL
ncbi:carbamoyltransferase [Streptomyces sp. CBMA123]|uniref:carbamoyltransferase family protein n=1 Tax=Streptomyces sp. CBMA123 TaxID=1896313 RepID=UPI001661EA2D|nr:carbamoyltransferase C-terminal domain-containing protein [Streptomyces sp. CBMA123]MBD0688849.1 carbamoyltransferase [Streptomyces sp. CBMA123]